MGIFYRLQLYTLEFSPSLLEYTVTIVLFFCFTMLCHQIMFSFEVTSQPFFRSKRSKIRANIRSFVALYELYKKKNDPKITSGVIYLLNLNVGDIWSLLGQVVLPKNGPEEQGRHPPFYKIDLTEHNDSAAQFLCNCWLFNCQKILTRCNDLQARPQISGWTSLTSDRIEEHPE